MTLFAGFDSINVGDSDQLVRTISPGDIRRFVEMTGDDNPLHVDAEFAESTPFKEIVVHGMLGASFLSTLIGTKLPGPGALWVSQRMDFLAPVRLGDELTVSCTVLKKHDRDRLLDLGTRIVNQRGQTVLSGEGQVKMLTARAKPAPAADAPTRRTALVTGASGGIGRAIALRLGRDGLAVIVNYRGNRERAEQVVAEIEAGGGAAIAVAADVSTPDGVSRLAAAAAKSFGGVDVLVNNASPRINAKPFAAIQWSDIQEHLDVQLRGAFMLTQACLPYMVKQSHGRIVNITSQAIDGSPSLTWTGYAVAKAALATMSRYLATEVGPSGITVNCVSPGMTDTRLIGDVSEKIQLMVARQTPLRRLATPYDVAGAVSYLASADAAFVTGHVLRVNGGISAS